MTGWPEYESHKVVRAARIVVIDRDEHGSVCRILVEPDPDGGAREEFWPTVDDMADRAEVDGYAMLYPDGFKSVSPAKAFEEGYTRK